MTTPSLSLLASRAARRILPRNVLLDRVASPVRTDVLHSLKIPVEALRVDLDEMVEWGESYVPLVVDAFGTAQRKKTLELYMTYKLLELTGRDVYLDAAGGRFSYAASATVRRAYLEDIRIAPPLRDQLQDKVDLLEAPADRIPLPDQSVDKISCHHALEHFQQDADIGFIQEVKRLLAPGGRCVIVPIFIGERHILSTDLLAFRFWNETGLRVRDPTATLPGGEACGSFARVYSLGSLRTRLLNRIEDEGQYSARLYCARTDDAELPGADGLLGPLGSRINRYYRALVIDRAT